MPTAAAPMPHLTVPAARCGPPRSGNGGWTAGALAARLLDGAGGPDVAPVTVRLHRPPPLDRPLPVTTPADDPGALVLLDDDADAPVATARAGALAAAPPAPVDVAAAALAEQRYAGLAHHPFPGCFACGPARQDGEGLRIFPGPVAEGRVAATWVPHPALAEDDLTLPTAVTWAALDCPGGWSSDLEDRPMVLGEMTAVVLRAPRAGVRHVVVGEHRRTEGRRTWTAASLWDGEDLVGHAEHVWVAIDPAAFA